MININQNLEKYVFDNLDAIYCPDAISATQNLNNDEEMNKKYLGTYFPRTFVEAYYIYEQLFLKEEVQENFRNKEEISVLIIGSGTGGDLIGLIQVLNSVFVNKKIKVFSFDGNKIALKYQREMIKELPKFLNSKNSIHVTTYTVKFKNAKSITDILENYNIQKVDIVQSFKMGNEIYNQSKGEEIFYELVNIAELYLNKSGIFVLEDVTNSNYDGKFNTAVMSSQVRKYFKENTNSNLRYIIPTCCAKWHKLCKYGKCFSKVEYKIIHRYISEVSKVTYKVFVKQPLGEQLIKYISDENCYELAPRTYCTNETYLYNQSFPPSSRVADPFKL